MSPAKQLDHAISIASIFSNISGVLHRQLEGTFPAALWGGRSTRQALALTFDDGPVPDATPALLADLAEFNIQATFFLVGSQAEANPDLVRQIADAGHQIGIHGYEHRAFPLLAKGALHTQLAHSQAIIARAANREPDEIIYVRPPYGVFFPTTLRVLQAWHFRPVMWSLVPVHWSQSLQATVDEVTTSAKPGTLLVLHEGLPGPSASDMVRQIIPYLQTEDYQFITIDEMWRDVMDKDIGSEHP